ncbi:MULTISPECIES: ABC-three component system middle component 8 [Gammaproteobacteria]|uniref:ABC-three component system middle component 8 n=1 Tax=Gammaproteobacteria TaxID=1236 RepID=UPI001FB82951|nr:MULTISPECIES: ABC-three component system middle component 8 [Gammaproteobacteria]MDH2274386.1 hypothetical protein [Moraxella porci]
MMIRPSKHNDPDKTLIYASFLILKRLKKSKIVSYEELLGFIKKEITSGEYLFLPALNFLFLLGLINYQAKNDMIEYVEQKK